MKKIADLGQLAVSAAGDFLEKADKKAGERIEN